MNIGYLAIAFALAFLTETFVEYVFGTPMDKVPKLAAWKWLLMYISMGAGIFLAFWYELDLVVLLASLVEIPMTASPVGFVLTGMGFGRGANWLHQFVSQYFPG